MDLTKLSARILQKASELGFEQAGICQAILPASVREHLLNFVEHGYEGEMSWLGERTKARSQPKDLWPQACRIISLGMSYAPKINPLHARPTPSQGNISIYAQNRDYHKIIKGKLKHLAQYLLKIAKPAYPEAAVKVFVDTAPVSEKPIAQQAGLGWQGKNTNIVSRSCGNWLFLGEIYTTIPLTVSAPEKSHCGSCTKCLNICPTNAFPAPAVMDARRCISYLMIEYSGSFPEELRPLMGNHIYGCDDCLAICPWNKFATPSPHEGFWPLPKRQNPSLAYLSTFDEQAFRNFFSASPIKRIGHARFLRNVLNALGNTKEPSLIKYTQAHCHSSEPIIRDSALWATQRLSGISSAPAKQNKRMNHYLKKRSITLTQHSTSIALEPEFWTIIDEMALRRHMTTTAIIREVDNRRHFDQALSSALRLTCLEWIMQHTTQDLATLKEKLSSLS